MSDGELAALLRDPVVSINVLYNGGEPAGFYELDGRGWPDMNLSYFGLMPHAIGSGVGFPFLRHAVDTVWREGPRGMTVNTCTADHPRAMPTYPTRRLPHVAAGARAMERAVTPWDAHSGTVADIALLFPLSPRSGGGGEGVYRLNNETQKLIGQSVQHRPPVNLRGPPHQRGRQRRAVIRNWS